MWVNVSSTSINLMVFYAEVNQVLVENTRFVGNKADSDGSDGTGLYADNSVKNFTARYNYFEDNEGPGLNAAWAENFVFHSNILDNNQTDATLGKPGQIKVRKHSNGKILSNTVYGRHVAGVNGMYFVDPNGGTLEIKNNIIQNHAQYAINDSDDGYTETISNNLQYGNTAGDLNNVTGSITSGDADFVNVDSGNFDGFRLRSDSPAIGIGDATVCASYNNLDPIDTSWPPTEFTDTVCSIGAFGYDYGAVRLINGNVSNGYAGGQ